MNCFHLFIFDISETVIITCVTLLQVLWIAFIYLSLTYQKQSRIIFNRYVTSCELLSFIYLWHIRNSSRLALLSWEAVVNCFHLFIFDISETVGWSQGELDFRLWIAFIYLSLTYQKQLEGVPANPRTSCELLSFIYLWHIRNSWLT